MNKKCKARVFTGMYGLKGGNATHLKRTCCRGATTDAGYCKQHEPNKRKTDEDLLDEEFAEHYSKPQMGIPFSTILGAMILGGLCWWGIYEVCRSIVRSTLSQ